MYVNNLWIIVIDTLASHCLLAMILTKVHGKCTILGSPSFSFCLLFSIASVSGLLEIRLKL